MFDSDESLIVSTKTEYDEVENLLRPKSMDGYVGQEKAKTNLSVFMRAAKLRGEPLDHVLLYGPPGLGKNTLAHIIAAEMVIYQTLNEFSAQGLYDQSGLSMNMFLKIREYLVKEEALLL